MTSAASEITQLLSDWRSGDQEALDRLMPLVYDELRLLAGRYLQRERPGHTLQATALVNEVWLRLHRQEQISWQNRTHFFAISARIMRHLLTDHARRKRSAGGGGFIHRITLNEDAAVSSPQDIDLLALDQALDRLARRDRRKSDIVELRYFGGLNAEETAAVLGISESTVKREWLKARAWLYREMNGTADSEE